MMFGSGSSSETLSEHPIRAINRTERSLGSLMILAALFSDLRNDLGEPELPIAIGELGVGGYKMVE